LCWYNKIVFFTKTSLFSGPEVLQAHKIGVKLATITAYPESQKGLKEDYNVHE